MSDAERPGQPVLDHLAISVSDLARSEVFYCDVMGADVIFPRHELEWGYRTVVRLGSHAIDINQLAGHDGARFEATRTGLDHLAFTADSIQELENWGSWLDANEVPRSAIRDVRADTRQDPNAPIVGAMFGFTDPDGIRLEFLYFEGEQALGSE